MVFKPRDSHGRESRTLFFVSVTVAITWVAMCFVIYRFFNDNTVSISDLATGFVTLSGVVITILGAWLGREWLNKSYAKKNEGIDNV